MVIAASIDEFKVLLSQFIKEKIKDYQQQSFTLKDLSFIYEISIAQLSNINNNKGDRVSLPTLLEILTKFGFAYEITLIGYSGQQEIKGVFSKKESL